MNAIFFNSTIPIITGKSHKTTVTSIQSAILYSVNVGVSNPSSPLLSMMVYSCNQKQSVHIVESHHTVESLLNELKPVKLLYNNS